MKTKRQNMSQEEWLFHSQKIHQKVLSHSIYQKAKTVGIYVHLPLEVETCSLIEAIRKEKNVCVPKVQGDYMNFYMIDSLNDLKEGCFHVK